MSQWLLLSISAMFAVQLLVACQPGDGRRDNPAAPAGPLGTEGTSDGGGGNGLDNKLYESYIRDPRELTAYQKRVKPILDALQSARTAHDQATSSAPKDADEKMSLHDYFSLKTWYFIPSDLQALSKDVLGVSFLKEKTQQIAFQKDREVWVNSKIFDAMTEEEQATLLVHEYLMSIYFMKFKSFEELCDMSQRAQPKSKCERPDDEFTKELLETHFKKAPLAPLQERDYENIRSMTNWMLRSGETATLKEFYTSLFDNGFDARFFNPDNLEKTKDDKPETITGTQVRDALVRAQHAGRLPNLCVDKEGHAIAPCQLTWSEEDFPLASGQNSVPILKLRIRDASRNVTAEADLGLHLETNLMTPFRHSNQSADSYVLISSTYLHADVLPGHPFAVIGLLFERKSDGVYEIQSLKIRQLILVERDGQKCRAEVPASATPNEKGFRLMTSEGTPETWTEKIVDATAPFAYCL